MRSPLKYFFFVYQWIVILPIAIVLTVITSLATILFAYTIKSPNLRALPARHWSKAICFLSFVKVTVEGAEHIDNKTSYIFVANHQSAFDIWLIYGWLNRPFSWVMKKELRKFPLVGFACEKAGHIFINRGNAKEAQKSIINAKKTLVNGQCVVVFPEGTRSKDGKVNAFKRGAFNMASDLQLPIVPITIVGAYEVMSSSAWHVRPGRLKMVIHKPIQCESKLTEQEVRKLAQDTRAIIVEGFPKN